MAGALPPADPPHAYVVEYRPLDRCFTPACQIRTRNLHGYASAVMEDGDPGAYVAQGPSPEHELFLQRGLLLRPGESYAFDLPEASYGSELDVVLSSGAGDTDYHAEIDVDRAALGARERLVEVHRTGHTAAFEKPAASDAGRFERYGSHVRLALPARAHRGLRISIVNRGHAKLAVGSPLVMRRVEGRGPRQGFFVVNDALYFHEAYALLSTGTHDAKADWVRKAVADRGIYYPAGQSPGNGTGEFVIRFFTGSYYAGAFGWPGMYGKGFDETLPLVQPGPVARAAEQGLVTAFIGDNFAVLPNFGNVGWDVAYNSELAGHPAAMARLVEQWAVDRPNDDALIVWWSAATHAPFPGSGREGSVAPLPDPSALPKTEIDGKRLGFIAKSWRNLLDTTDKVQLAYDALTRAAPSAKRMTWMGADHSSGITKKMARRSYRLPSYIATDLGHVCGGTSEEANTPFALIFDDPAGKQPPFGAPRTVSERTNELLVWRALEAYLGLDLDLARQTTFQSPLFPDPHAPPVWDDRVLASIGFTGVLRASAGSESYAIFLPRIDETPAWSLTASEQLLLTGGPSRQLGFMDEELFDDSVDPYEYANLAGKKVDDTLRMRREVSDWLAAQWEDHSHPRHRNKLAFPVAVDVDLFAPRPFTALVDDVPIVPADARLVHVHGKEVVIVEGAQPIGIVEVRGAGASSGLVLKCSANGLPLDVLTEDRPRFNLEVARTNCPLPAGPPAVAGPGEVLVSFEPAAAGGVAPRPGAPAVGNATGPVENDELLAGMKRWGYVRDIDDKKKP
ncbi:MAG: hypothetical protein NVS3B10_05240 [Polyangiales bacterium]